MKTNRITFRSIRSHRALTNCIDFLKADVMLNGGTASEIISLHGALEDIAVSRVPGGLIVIRKPVSRLEALGIVFASMEND